MLDEAALVLVIGREHRVAKKSRYVYDISSGSKVPRVSMVLRSVSATVLS